MRITRKRMALTAGGLALASLSVLPLSCSNQLNDLGGIGQVQPDYAVTILNVDGFPNITQLCYQGVAFATTTRDYTSLVRIPEWDPFCRTQEKGTVPQPAVISPSATATP